MALDFHMVVEPDGALLPFREDVRRLSSPVFSSVISVIRLPIGFEISIR